MNLRKEDGTPYSDKLLRDVVINFILAGRDTTANTLSWLFYELMRRPDIQEKVREELRRVMSNGAKAGEESDRWGEVPTYDELSEMHYLHATITESLRLHPPVPIDPKTVRWR